MIKNLIFAVAVLAAAWSFPSVAGAQDESFWIGRFEHEDGGGKEFEQLIVKRTEGTLTAEYQSESMAQLFLKFTLTVEVKGDKAYFYYDRCVPKGKLDYTDPYPCEKDKNTKGDLMFTLVKIVGRNKRPIIRTLAGKLDEVNRTDHMFFEKVRHPYNTLR